MITKHKSEITLLLRGLREPLDIDEMSWERLLRLARASGLHARLAEANLDNATVTDAVRRHLVSSARIANYRAQSVRAELFHLTPLVTSDFPVIVLKGAAYVLQRRRLAVGRFVSDVDLLVPSEHLRTMEDRLRAGGWQAEKLTPYDERYYRDWSHETPPMRQPGHSLEVDLHHALTPVTGSLAFDPACLFEHSEPIPGTPFRALCPQDQVLHACLHCFHDGELDLRLREVVDIDGLLRTFADRADFWRDLIDRANELGLQRPLWYGLHFAHAWLDCPVPLATREALSAPSALSRMTMDALVPMAMFPSDPDFPPPFSARLARLLMRTRYHLLRMPLHMLLPHLARKAALRLRARITQKKEAPDDGAP